MYRKVFCFISFRPDDNAFCHKRGSYYKLYVIPTPLDSLKCIVSQEGVTSRDNAPDTAFYQWVTFMMAAQVLIL